MKNISPVTGNISAVFNTSFDVRIKDYLFNFTTSMDKVHPYSVLVNAGLVDKVHKGMLVSLNFPVIKLGSRGLYYKSCVDGIKIKKIGGAFCDNVSLLKKYLNLFGNMSELPFLREILPSGFSFVNGVDANSYFNFFGWGDGLTPSFDDYFSGILMADRFCGNNYIKTGKEFFKKLKKKTTLTSYWQAMCADSGKLALIFEKVLYQLFCKKIDLKDILRCVNMGSTSGSNILGGIEFYCSSFIKNRA
jgi:hypothetical protein